MKRNMEYVRTLLIDTEKLGEDGNVEFQILLKDPIEAWHGGMLMEAGYLYGEMEKDEYGSILWCRVVGMTWKGCELLDTIRDDNVWNRIKTSFKGKVVSASTEVLMNIGTNVALNMIGLRG